MVRRFSAPDTVPHGGALQSISMSYADGFSIAHLMDFQIGAEGEAIEFLGQEANAFRPTATADFHLGANTIFEYRYSTTEPNTRASKGFDTAPADLTESAPRMTMLNGDPLLENAHHHEMSLSERMGDNKLQLAYYNDRVKDPALLGVGVINTYTGDILPDPYSGTFSYNGGELRAQGVRFVFQHRVSNNFTRDRRLCLRWRARTGAAGRFLDCRPRQSGQRLAPFGGPEAEWIRAALAHQVDCLLSLDQWTDAGSGRPVQRLGGTD